MSDVKTFTVIAECDQVAGRIDKVLNITWSGTLESAVISGSVSGDFIGGIANVGAYLEVNGIQTPITVNGGPTHQEGAFAIDVSNWLRQGGNQIAVGFNTYFGVAGEVQICCTCSATIQASGTISPPPPPPPSGGGPNLTQIVELIVAVVIIAVAAGLFLRARG